MEMSEYFADLSEEVKARYKAKVEIISLTLEDDPYATNTNVQFVNDMTGWPCVEYGHIFGYFIKQPGVYTQE